MRKTVKSFDNLYQISESLLMEAVKYIPDEEESGIRKVLEAAEEFKSADMTPIYIYDLNNMEILVVAEETFGKRLH